MKTEATIATPKVRKANVTERPWLIQMNKTAQKLRQLVRYHVAAMQLHQ